MIVIVLVEGWILIDLATNITIIIVLCILFYEFNKKIIKHFVPTYIMPLIAHNAKLFMYL